MTTTTIILMIYLALSIYIMETRKFGSRINLLSLGKLRKDYSHQDFDFPVDKVKEIFGEAITETQYLATYFSFMELNVCRDPKKGGGMRTSLLASIALGNTPFGGISFCIAALDIPLFMCSENILNDKEEKILLRQKYVSFLTIMLYSKTISATRYEA